MLWAPWHQSAEDVLPFIRLTRQQIANNDGMQTVILDPKGRIVGMVGVHGIDWRNSSTTIGYWLSRDEQGSGTMTAAVRAYVDHAFGTWKLNRVTIRAAAGNVPAARSPSASASTRRARCARSSAWATTGSTVSSTRCSRRTGRAAEVSGARAPRARPPAARAAR